MKIFQNFHCTKNHFEMSVTFFVIEARGFKFWVLGLLVADFQQLKRCISCRVPLMITTQQLS